MEKKLELRDFCPSCQSRNIMSFGIETSVDDNGAAVLEETGECHDCGCEWQDVYEISRSYVDGVRVF